MFHLVLMDLAVDMDLPLWEYLQLNNVGLVAAAAVLAV
jgi:hypothetical protein